MTKLLRRAFTDLIQIPGFILAAITVVTVAVSLLFVALLAWYFAITEHSSYLKELHGLLRRICPCPDCQWCR